jgi:hypothetical protein
MSDDIQHFEGTVEKVREDGTRVMSSYLEGGERLASEVDAEKQEENLRAVREDRGKEEDRGLATEEKTVTSKSASGHTSTTRKG